ASRRGRERHARRICERINDAKSGNTEKRRNGAYYNLSSLPSSTTVMVASPFVVSLGPNASNAFNVGGLNCLGQTAIAPTPGRARAEDKAGLGPTAAAVADPQEEETEHQEGGQGRHHQDRPDQPEPQPRGNAALDGRLRIGKRARVEMRPKVPEAEQVERPLGPPGQPVMHDCCDGHGQQKPSQCAKHYHRSPKWRRAPYRSGGPGGRPLPGPSTTL